MAGKKGRSGRKPAKPDAVRLADGTYRSDRHGLIELKPQAGGLPRKPIFACRHAEQLWDDIAAELAEIGVVKRIDASLLQSLCELWGLYRKSYAIAAQRPIDRDARISVVAYWAKFEQAAARFGLNPQDRSRLQIDKPKQGVRRRQA